LDRKLRAQQEESPEDVEEPVIDASDVEEALKQALSQ